ncbi:hypothetical protein NM688_g9047 [Phlebia brevispora]|uniref:Uncharacterized protein n=1 Tax=Phlebia brevispora TaxID=194682 RepID=A0ACC1RLS9_9APHY|nr:hypothetical protein NM688_g9047 [Phlebia brevispora]
MLKFRRAYHTDRRRHKVEAPLSGQVDDAREGILDQIRLLSEVLGIIADGPLNVPLLKSVGGLTEKIVAIVQTVRSNKSDCLDLAEQICEHLGTIATAYYFDLNNAERLTIDQHPSFCKHVEALHTRVMHSYHRTGCSLNSFLVYRNLESALLTVREISSRSKWRRLLSHESDKRKIAVCRDRLQHVFTKFHLGATIVNAHETWHLRHDIAQFRQAVDCYGAKLFQSTVGDGGGKDADDAENKGVVILRSKPLAFPK